MLPREANLVSVKGREPSICYICGEIEGDPATDLISLLLEDQEYVRRVVLENRHFAAIPSLGAVVPGHMLLCSRRHVCGFGGLSAEELQYVDAFRGRLVAAMARIFPQRVHTFEHGSGGIEGRQICSVGHAHLHLVPADVDVREVLSLSTQWIRVEGGISTLPEVSAGREYLYYETPDGEAFALASENVEFESQYLRRVFASALGKPGKWNWREAPMPELAHQTFAELRQALSECIEDSAASAEAATIGAV